MSLTGRCVSTNNRAIWSVRTRRISASTEELISRRRAAGNQYWYVNVGLASPTVPAAAKEAAK